MLIALSEITNGARCNRRELMRPRRRYCVLPNSGRSFRGNRLRIRSTVVEKPFGCSQSSSLRFWNQPRSRTAVPFSLSLSPFFFDRPSLSHDLKRIYIHSASFLWQGRESESLFVLIPFTGSPPPSSSWSSSSSATIHVPSTERQTIKGS